MENRDDIKHSAGLLSRRMQLLIKEEVSRPAGIKWAFHLTEGSAAVGLTSALFVHLLNPVTGNCGIITTFSQQWNHSVERQKLKFAIIWHCVVLLEDYSICFKKLPLLIMCHSGKLKEVRVLFYFIKPKFIMWAYIWS